MWIICIGYLWGASPVWANDSESALSLKRLWRPSQEGRGFFHLSSFRSDSICSTKRPTLAEESAAKRWQRRVSHRHLQSIAPLSGWGRGMFWWKKTACDAQGFYRLAIRIAVPLANAQTGAGRAGKEAWRFRDAHSGLIIHILHNWPTSTSISARLPALFTDPDQVFTPLFLRLLKVRGSRAGAVQRRWCWKRLVC